MEFKYRDVQARDLESVVEIAQQCFDDYSREDYFNMSTDNNYKFIVASLNNKIVGFLIFLKIDYKLEIIKIATDPNQRRLGVASGLMRFIQEYANCHEYCGVILEVNECNLPARALYSKFGFIEIHIRKKYYHNTDDAIIMEWNKN